VRFGPVSWRYAAHRQEATATRSDDPGPTYVARHTTWLPSCWEIADGEHVLSLTADQLSHWVTVRRDATEIGRAGPARNWTSRPCLEIEPPLAPGLAVFVLWVHHASASSAGAG
jgi:hypothetical protein